MTYIGTPSIANQTTVWNGTEFVSKYYASPNVFEYQPNSGTPGGNIFTDWSLLVAAVAASPGHGKTIIFSNPDPTDTTPVVIPAGTWDLGSRTEWIGIGPIQVFGEDGCTFSEISYPSKMTDLSLDNPGASPYWTLTNDAAISLYGFCQLSSSGTASIIETSASSFTIILYDNSSLFHAVGGGTIVLSTSSGFAFIQVSGAARVQSDLFIGFDNGVEFDVYDVSADIDTQQGGATPDLELLTFASLLNYDDSKENPQFNVTNVQDALDAIKTTTPPVVEFEYQPNTGTPGGNIYTDWSLLVAAAALHIGDAKKIRFSNSSGGPGDTTPIVIPAGFWDLNGRTEWESNGNGTVISGASGCTFGALPYKFTNITIEGIDAAYFNANAAFSTSLEGNTSFQGSTIIIDIAASINFTINMHDQSKLDGGGNILIDGANAIVNMYDATQVATNVFDILNLTFNISSPYIIEANSTQNSSTVSTNFITNTGAKYTSYDDSLINPQLSANNIQTAIDILKVNISQATTSITSTSLPYATLPVDVLILSTTSGTLTLEASPANGRKIIIKDGTGNASSSNIIIDGNGNMIDGASNYTIAVNYEAVEIVYDNISGAWYLI